MIAFFGASTESIWMAISVLFAITSSMYFFSESESFPSNTASFSRTGGCSSILVRERAKVSRKYEGLGNEFN